MEQISTLESYVAETHHMFYVDYPWKVKGELDGLFKKYFVRFVTGYEISKVQKVKHIQCYGLAPPAKYRAFIAKYKSVYRQNVGKTPSGRASLGTRKNYGRVKNIIKSVENCIAYCIKDNNYSYYNIPTHLMDYCKTISYQTDSIKEKKQEMERLCKQLINDWVQGLEQKLMCITAIVEKHFKLFHMPLAKTTLEKYLLSSGLVTFERYARANFETIAWKYCDPLDSLL